jgi:hypothetical protein
MYNLTMSGELHSSDVIGTEGLAQMGFEAVAQIRGNRGHWRLAAMVRDQWVAASGLGLRGQFNDPLRAA